MRPEILTLVLVNMAGIMERTDLSLLPAVCKEVGVALHTDPTGLGLLSLYRSIVQTAGYPLATYLALHHNRAHMIALGAFLWAAATFFVAVSSTFFQLTGNFGSIIGGFCSVVLASTSVMGISGWRIAFHLVAFVSVIVGILVSLFAKDPRFSERDIGAKTLITPKNFWSDLQELLQEAKSVMRIPSFQVIVAQGVTGSFTASALSFVPMWLELVGFSHEKTASLWTVLVIGFSLGGLFGGRMGDILAKRLPNSGRIILAQITSFSAVPVAAILLLLLPDDPSTAFIHGLVLLVMGFLMSWHGPATNNPIFAEIVPEKSRTSIYALDRTFESIIASFAPAVVGILSQHVYGYKPISKGSSRSAEFETDRKNAASLAKSLYIAIGIPRAICGFIYSCLYCTYPRDRDRARLDALIEAEMQQLEAQNSSRSEIDINYEAENSLELDDTSENATLISY